MSEFWIGVVVAVYVVLGELFLLSWNHRRQLHLLEAGPLLFLMVPVWWFIAAADSVYGSLEHERKLPPT